MSNFLDQIKELQSYKLTENGAIAYDTTQNALLDLFAEVGALRYRDEDEIKEMYEKVLIEDKELATKLAFYARDVREGLGERKTGRILLKVLAENYPELLKQNIELIPEYGRWDDLAELFNSNSELKENFLEAYAQQLKTDYAAIKENPEAVISLAGKWAPSINASSGATRQLAIQLKKEMGLNSAEYRHMLSDLRENLKVVERDISAKTYENIDYESVPSKAMNRYNRLFEKRDEDRFKEYLESVQQGEKKINASVLFPYDIVEKYLYKGERSNVALEEQWKALPDYVQGENNFLILADVSGSMHGRPMATSVGLALYFAERNEGDFHNYFMTFSANPKLVEIKGETLSEKINYIKGADWGMNTNLEKAFDLILDTAVKNNTPQEEMPKSLVVISDMEIDYASKEMPFTDLMKEKYEEAGYELPNLVYWNVAARQNTYHAQQDEENVQLISGSSPTQFRELISGVSLTPEQMMVQVLDGERYEKIQVPEKYKDQYVCKSDVKENINYVNLIARCLDNNEIINEEAEREVRRIINSDTFKNSEIKVLNGKLTDAEKCVLINNAQNKAELKKLGKLNTDLEPTIKVKERDAR